ncbi:MAG: hypothetical protein PHX40_02575 [Bacilli bacterium]|nr:hypothetical protein [Bacilli bacterium]
MKAFYKKYKVFIYIGLFLIMGIISFLFLKNFLYPDDYKSAYGSRLDGIENVTIDSTRKNEILSIYQGDENIQSINIDIKGKIINLIINANESLTIELAKENFLKSLENFKEDEKVFYDIQFFVKNEILKYTMIGYKNATSEVIVWSEYSEVLDEAEAEEE